MSCILTTALTLEDVARLRSLLPDTPKILFSPRRRVSDSSLIVHIASPPEELGPAIGPNIRHIYNKYIASKPPTSKQPQVQVTNTSPQKMYHLAMTTIPVLLLLRGDYVGGEEPNEWMRQLDLNLPTTWTEPQKVEHYRRQCAPGSLAEAWFATLTLAQTATWSGLEVAFLIRWPPALPLQLTAGQKKERLKAVVLKEAEIGTMLDDEKGQEWGHVRWARQVQRLAQSFGDNNCQFLDVVLDGVPDLLRDHLSDTYPDWAAFLAEVNGVSINLLARARVRAAEERTMRKDIAQLKARLQPQQQVPPTRTYHTNPPAYRPYPRQVSNVTTIPATQAPAVSMQQPASQTPSNFVPTMQYQIPAYQSHILQ